MAGRPGLNGNLDDMEWYDQEPSGDDAHTAGTVRHFNVAAWLDIASVDATIDLVGKESLWLCSELVIFPALEGSLNLVVSNF